MTDIRKMMYRAFSSSIILTCLVIAMIHLPLLWMLCEYQSKNAITAHAAATVPSEKDIETIVFTANIDKAASIPIMEQAYTTPQIEIEEAYVTKDIIFSDNSYYVTINGYELYVNPTLNPDWDSTGHITPKGGVYDGPSGKETYYNLPMEGVVKIMRRLGYDETNWPYWERDDGCKMLGDYIMVAADLNIRPRGSIVETSMGPGIVCDTGEFIYENNLQLDIAVTW